MKHVQSAVVILLVTVVIILGAVTAKQHNQITNIQSEVKLQWYILQLLSEDTEKIKAGKNIDPDDSMFQGMYSSVGIHKENTN